MNTAIHSVMCEAHTAIDIRGEKVTRTKLVAWCDEHLEVTTGERYSVIGEMRSGLIKAALMDADAADETTTVEAKAAERERIRVVVLDIAGEELAKAKRMDSTFLIAIAARSADRLTR